MTQTGTDPTSPARDRTPLSAVIMSGLLAVAMFGGSIVFAWFTDRPLISIVSVFVAIPFGAIPMYKIMARIIAHRELTRTGQSPHNPQRLLMLLNGFAIGTMVVAIALVLLHLLSAAGGFASGILGGLFWWMVRDRSADASK